MGLTYFGFLSSGQTPSHAQENIPESQSAENLASSCGEEDPLEDLFDNWPSDNQTSIHHEQPAVQWLASADTNLPKINQPGQTINQQKQQ